MIDDGVVAAADLQVISNLLLFYSFKFRVRHNFLLSKFFFELSSSSPGLVGLEVDIWK